jgi:pyridoxal/pyridoxine/pyridoxamine kinase
VAPTSLIFVPKLNKVISGWQESYLSNFDCLLIGYVPSDTPAPDPGGTVCYERE